MNRRSVSLALFSVVAIACSHSPPHTATVMQQGAPSVPVRRRDPGLMIDPAMLRRDLYIIADDSFHGRGTGTADARRAAAFLARRAQQLGLEPAGDSLYVQRVPMAHQTVARSTQFAVMFGSGQKQNLRVGADVSPVASFGDDMPTPVRSAEGDLLFLGTGPANEREDQALLPLNPQGRVLVIVNGMPNDGKLDPGTKNANDSLMILRMAHAMSLQPAALVVLMSGKAESEYQRLLRTMLETIVLDGADSQTSAKQMPMVVFGVAKRGSPLLPTRWPNDTMPQLLDRQLSAHVEIERKPFIAYNVVAVARGSDPRLNKTYVAYGAHYDHIGVIPAPAHGGRRAASDSIANGADDDGSGSVALLAIAREMMVYRPRRSALFVWHVGEENGLLGSKYFTAHSTVPIDSIVTQFNADMIGRNDSNTVALIGPRAAPNYQSWRLGMIVDSVNRALPTPLHIERKWDDPDDADRMYERSDQYPYAKKGIPVIFFTTGPHEDYHKVSDEPSKIDYDKMARIAQLMVESGLAVANRSHRPTSEALLQSISSRQP
jgi:hypothetical protein